MALLLPDINNLHAVGDYTLLYICLAGRFVFHYSLSSNIFIISTAALATDVPGPKIAATPA